MAEYTYECSLCDGRFDVIKKMEDPHPDECVLCHRKGGVQRKFFPAGIVFRGSGFYSTDKALDRIDPEYDLNTADQERYYNEKLLDAGVDRGGGDGW